MLRSHIEIRTCALDASKANSLTMSASICFEDFCSSSLSIAANDLKFITGFVDLRVKGSSIFLPLLALICEN